MSFYRYEKPKHKSKFHMSRYSLRVSILVAVMVIGAVVFLATHEENNTAYNISLTQLSREINRGQVEQITADGSQLRVNLNDGTRQLVRLDAPVDNLPALLEPPGTKPEALQSVNLSYTKSFGIQAGVALLITLGVAMVILMILFSLILAFVLTRNRSTRHASLQSYPNSH